MEMNVARAALLAVTLFFTGCDNAPDAAQTPAAAPVVLEGKTMGTFWGGSFFRYSRNAWLDAMKSTALSIRSGTFSPNLPMMISPYYPAPGMRGRQF